MVIMTILSVSSCQEVAPRLPVAFGYVTVDEFGNPIGSFKHGNKLFLKLSIINLSDSEIQFKHTSLTNEDLFKVFKLNPNNEYLDLGKPFSLIRITEIFSIPIYSKDTLSLTVPWIFQETVKCLNQGHFDFCLDKGASQPDLPVGEYALKFSDNFEFLIDGQTINSGLLEFNHSFFITN